MIDLATLRPFPTWGEPIPDDLVTVTGYTIVDRKPIMISYRVVVMPNVPREMKPALSRGSRKER